MISNIDQTKVELEAEREKLENELKGVATKDPLNSSNWDPSLGERENSSADENEAADAIEDYEGNTAITNSLESRFGDIVIALNKIELGKYGLCEVCEKEIESDRLEANPAARTCKEHIESL